MQSGPTRFGSQKELRAALNPGDIIFGKRPLDLGNLAETTIVDGFRASLGNVLNTELLHEQAFFLDDDGELRNRSFFDSNQGGIVRRDRNFPGNIGSYRFGPIYLHQNLNNRINFYPPGFGPGTYRLMGNNCQDYASAIRAQFR